MGTPERKAETKRAERIVDRLIKESDSGEFAWEVGAAPDSYAADVQTLRMRVRSRDGDARPPYVFELWNSENNLTLETESDSSEPELDKKILMLYSRGKHAALNPFKALDALERELGLEPD